MMIAATIVPITVKAGKGVIAIPPTVSVDANSRSATDETISQTLGARGPQMPALTIGIGGGLIAEHDDDEGQRLQCTCVEPDPVCTNSQDGRTK